MCSVLTGPLAGYASLWQLAFSILRDIASQQALNPTDTYEPPSTQPPNPRAQTLVVAAESFQRDSLAERLINLLKAASLPQAQIGALQWLTQLQLDERSVAASTADECMAERSTSTAELGIGTANEGTTSAERHTPTQVHNPATPHIVGEQGHGVVAQGALHEAGSQVVQGVQLSIGLKPSVSALLQSNQHAQDSRGDSSADRPSPRRRAEITHTRTLQPTFPNPTARTSPAERGHTSLARDATADERETEAARDRSLPRPTESVGGSAAPTTANDRTAVESGIPTPVWDAILGAATDARDESFRLAAACSLLELLEPPGRLSRSQLATLTVAAPERLGDVARDIRSAWREILLKVAANEDGDFLGDASTGEGRFHSLEL